MKQQQQQGLLLDGDTLAEYLRLEAEANAKTSKSKAALSTLATTQQAGRQISVCAGLLEGLQAAVTDSLLVCVAAWCLDPARACLVMHV